MLTRDDIFAVAAEFPGTVTDSPFEDNPEAVVLRHGDSGKWYGLLFRAPCRKIGIDRDGETDILNLKCDPMVSYGVRETFASVIPAYHMNKYHWISIILEKGLPADTLEMLVGMSFDLTKVKRRGRKKSE